MDAAVALVEGYLHINGYLTVTEYAVVEKVHEQYYRSMTDVDILAVRLPGAGRILPTKHADPAKLDRALEPDPQLVDNETDQLTDIIIAEVKEGRAELNPSAKSPDTLITAIRRITDFEPETARKIARDIARHGISRIPERQMQIRLFAFGTRKEDLPSGCKVMLISECLHYLAGLAKDYDRLSGAMQIRNPTINLLSILAKSGVSISPPEPSGNS